jgi:predicted PurR-regulated permease PerM
MLKENPHNHNISNIFFIIIIAIALYISHKYIQPIIWAGLIVITTWPAYQLLLKKVCRNNNTVAASIATITLCLMLFTPITLVIIQVIKEIQQAIHFFQIHHTGITEPAGLAQTPIIGKRLHEFWQHYLAQPQLLRTLSNEINTFIHTHLPSLFSSIKTVSSIIIKHALSIFFFFLFIFFLYKDGDSFEKKLNQAGFNLLGSKWNTYFTSFPKATRGIVLGTLCIGIGVGILMGICYSLLGMRYPILFGLLTAILAMIPFGIVLAVTLSACLLIVQGSVVSAIILITFSIILTFITDHFIKPAIIGGSTHLHFILILVGILGGVETLGVIGLFLGPIFMLFMRTLFNEVSKPTTL